MFLGREYFRALNARAPQIVERLISLQGSAGFSDYVDDLLHKEGDATAERWDAEVSSALVALKAEHERSFPQAVTLPRVHLPQVNDIRNDKIRMIAQRFPHVGRNLTDKWGSRDFANYVGGLLIDTRGGRQGFPSEVLFALAELREQHEQEYPEFVRQETNVWVQVD